MTEHFNSTFSPKYIAFLLASCLLYSCGNAKEVSYKSSGVTQTFTEGKASVSKDFESYIYPDATTAGSVSAEGENEEQSKFLMLTSKASLDTVSKWYRDKLKEEQWKIVNQQEQPKLISITGCKNNTELNVMITEENGSTSISLSIAKQVDSNESDENKSENYVPNKDTPPTD